MDAYLGRRIRLLREEQCLSQADLAVRSRLPLRRLVRLESGVENPGPRVRAELATALDVPESMLIPEPHAAEARVAFIAERLVEALEALA